MLYKSVRCPSRAGVVEGWHVVWRASYLVQDCLSSIGISDTTLRTCLHWCLRLWLLHVKQIFYLTKKVFSFILTTLRTCMCTHVPHFSHACTMKAQPIPCCMKIPICVAAVHISSPILYKQCIVHTPWLSKAASIITGSCLNIGCGSCPNVGVSSRFCNIWIHCRLCIFS